MLEAVMNNDIPWPAIVMLFILTLIVASKDKNHYDN